LGGELRFPLETTQPARLAVPPLAAGEHCVELRFHLANAMEGVFTHLYLEGDFLAEVGETAPAIRPDAPTDARTGWPDAGLPFYGGDGVYRWSESFTAAEAKAAWSIAFDDIVDAAELLVNGQSVGSRAWAPFRWSLAHLHAGENQFELRVSSTAGNRFKLIYPRQPQGWLGQAHLLR
jgi:hypothetical protein